MRRRSFIVLLGMLMPLWPFAATAERPQRVRRIGVLMTDAPPNNEIWVFARAVLDAFQQRLQELGWIAGRNAEIDVRWAPADRLRVYAAELVRLSPDVLVGTDTPTTKALRDATQTIPIVFVAISDPIGTGLISNLARPEGNLTGFTDFEYSMGGKWLELLKDIAPKLMHIAFLFNPSAAPFAKQYIQSAQDAAARLSVTLSAEGVPDTETLERAIATLASTPNGGLIAMPDVFNFIHTRLIAELAERHHVPAVYSFPFSTARGGLLAYSTDIVELFRRGATYVDRILRGASPADLPVQQPNKFDLSINLKTARAIGLVVPASLLARADEVIE
jgi:putative tryptophan/tyrosine transport system substrate-binding protein